MFSRGRGRGRGPSRRACHLLQRPSPSTHIEHPKMQICGNIQLDAKDDKSQVHDDHYSGGSSITKFSRHLDELVVIRSTSMDFGKLTLVHDPPVQVLNSLKHLDNQSGSKSVQVARILRPGMVLMKNFISHRDQVKIVQTCQKLGRGDGGFYQPVFSNGGSVHSKIMCLGKHWDCETKLYAERRAVDGAEPPPIPSEFHHLVQKAIRDAHACLLKEVTKRHVESVLPSMTPDICIVNFYTSTGRLGLHKDKSESQASLNRGLPVVSFSIGDSAEFMYGDQRDLHKAEKIVLESGDVLIFGGKSRHVYHGVASILTKTAPQALLQETGLRPGRLNLTFRKY